MRFLFRIIGYLCVAGGFVALVIDGTRAIANDQWIPISFGDVAARAFPKSFPFFEPFVTSKLHPIVWNPVLASVLATPAFVVGMGFGFLLLFLARARRNDSGLALGRR